MKQQFVIDTIQGFDGGAPFQMGARTPDFEAGTDPVAGLNRVADWLDESDAPAWPREFLRALSARIHVTTVNE